MSTTAVQGLVDRLKHTLVAVAEGHLLPAAAYNLLCGAIDDGALKLGFPRDSVGFIRLAELMRPIAFPKAYHAGPLRLDDFPSEDLRRSYVRSIGLCLIHAKYHGDEKESIGARMLDAFISREWPEDDEEVAECGDRDR